MRKRWGPDSTWCSNKICTTPTAGTEKEKRRWMCYTVIVLNLKRATMNEFPQEWVLDVPDRGEAFT